MMHKSQHLLEFDDFRADTEQRLLFHKEKQVPLSPKAFDTLAALIEAGGQVVSKEDLLKTVWPDTFVEEGSLARNISTLRKALGDSPDDQRYIQTIPKRGYRFLVPIRQPAPPQQPALPPPPATRSWRMAALLALCLSAAGLLYWHFRATPPQIRSIAVLPLSNLSGDPADEHFADGVTDAIITSIAQIRSLRITSRTSVLRFKRTSTPLPEIARTLGVDAILEGSVRREGTQVRITAQLIHASTDSHLWAHSYEGDVSDSFRLEGELAADIARQVKAQLETELQTRLRNAPRVSFAAQQEYNAGLREQDLRDLRHLTSAIDHFEKAIAAEPSFAAAYARLARAWIQKGIFGGFGFRQAEVPARKAALRALELDPNLAEAHNVLAHILFFYDFAWVTAESEFRRALELDPNNSTTHINYANLLVSLGRFHEAEASATRAVSLDPLSVTINSDFARILFRTRKYEESIRHFLQTMKLDPESGDTNGRLADVYMQVGRIEEARALVPRDYIRLARAEALLGNKKEALDALAQVPANVQENRQLELSLVYFALGKIDTGFEALARGIDKRQFVAMLASDPRFDSVRKDPRFPSLIAKLNFPQKPANQLP
ncbi:MAG: winged helix-turn-helix domain-containing protein [Bryobacteraceae bacterium]